MKDISMSFLGGALIGLSASILLLSSGRILGVSGILNNSFSVRISENSWRLMFIAGLLIGGCFLRIFKPELLENKLGQPPVVIVVSGILVGFGTLLGNGCTSGHAVCGMSRLSIRSMAATATFLLIGALTATTFAHFFSAVAQ